jgi:uncharacterized protein (DUF1800 family)
LKVFIPSNSNPWNKEKAKLLLRRMGFCTDLNSISRYLLMTPGDVIDELLQESKDLSSTTAPEWGYWDNKEFNDSGKNKSYYHTIWQKQAFADFQKNAFRERLVLFWSNHFVVEYKDVNQPAYLYQYYVLLQTQVLGNFKTFVHKVGLTPAMLRYLNGYDNKNSSPNENYGRELYELFTLGQGNGYVQEDITETSRALTGYNKTVRYGPITFNEKTFDKGSKTIFGRSGNWGYDDVIDILFDEKKDIIARFICEKIYKYFVSPTTDEAIVSSLAATMISNNFELAPVYSQLFKSEHFFDKKNSNVLIKSPIDLMLGLHKTLGFKLDDTIDLEVQFRNKCRDMGQIIFSPVDVAGWQGNQDWINSETLPKRWEFSDYLLIKYWKKNRNQFKKLIISLVGNNETELNVIVNALKDFMFCPCEIKDEELSEAIAVFIGEVPENYFEDGTWSINDDSVPKQVYDLMRFFITLPEFQLK